MIRGSMSEQFGFKTTKRSVHSARSMMSREVAELLMTVHPDAPFEEYEAAVVEKNVLGKSTISNRTITFLLLKTLYTFDPKYALFRAFRKLQSTDMHERTFLTFQLAYARDPLLRGATAIVQALPLGGLFQKEPVENFVRSFPNSSFSPNSVASFTRNMSSTWSQAGFLSGEKGKRRIQPKIGVYNVSFACLCAYLDGWQGEVLFEAPWIRLLDRSRSEIELLMESASRLGQIRLLKAGGVYEFRFPGYLTTEEEEILHG